MRYKINENKVFLNFQYQAAYTLPPMITYCNDPKDSKYVREALGYLSPTSNNPAIDLLIKNGFQKI